MSSGIRIFINKHTFFQELGLESFTFAKWLQNGYNPNCLRETNTYQEVSKMCNFDCSAIWQILSQLCGFCC